MVNSKHWGGGWQGWNLHVGGRRRAFRELINAKDQRSEGAKGFAGEIGMADLHYYWCFAARGEVV